MFDQYGQAFVDALTDAVRVSHELERVIPLARSISQQTTYTFDAVWAARYYLAGLLNHYTTEGVEQRFIERTQRERAMGISPTPLPIVRGLWGETPATPPAQPPTRGGEG